MSVLRTECEGVVPGDPGCVYAVVADFARRPRWMRELRAVEAAAGPAVAGQRVEASSVVFAHQLGAVSHVERAEPGTVLVERVHVGAGFTSEWAFEPAGPDATRVRHTMVVDLPGGPLRPLERLVLRRRVRRLQQAALTGLATEVRRGRS